MWSNKHIVSTKQAVQCQDKDVRLFKSPDKATSHSSWIMFTSVIFTLNITFNFYGRLENVRLTSILEHLWMWDYLNVPASGDVWIIIQPFFRRLEPQAAAVSRRRGWGIGRWWKWGEGGEAGVTSWGETKHEKHVERVTPVRESE